MRHGHENLALDIIGARKEQSHGVHLDVREYKNRGKENDHVIRMNWGSRSTIDMHYNLLSM